MNATPNPSLLFRYMQARQGNAPQNRPGCRIREVTTRELDPVSGSKAIAAAILTGSSSQICRLNNGDGSNKLIWGGGSTFGWGSGKWGG